MSDYGGWQALALAQTRVQRREHDESSQLAMPPCCWAFRRAGLANCPPVSRTRRVPPALHRHEWISMLQSAGFGSRRLRPPARCTPRTGCAEHPGTSATTPAAGLSGQLIRPSRSGPVTPYSSGSIRTLPRCGRFRPASIRNSVEVDHPSYSATSSRFMPWPHGARRQVSSGRQVTFLPVETLLCLAASFLVNHWCFGGSTAH